MENKNDNFQHHAYGREAKLEQLNFVLDIGKRVLQEMESYTNFKFPINKMDQIASPDMKTRAMSHLGLVTYKEEEFYYGDDELNDQKKSLTMLVAHEFAHQWFGSIVTPEWWKYNWLSEGFASLCGSLILDIMNDNTREMDEYALRLQDIMQYDASDKTRAMNFDPIDYDKLMDLFDNIAYFKGWYLSIIYFY